ncbi:Protein nedd1, partial [Chytridiales sp. JEL 0842]
MPASQLISISQSIKLWDISPSTSTASQRIFIPSVGSPEPPLDVSWSTDVKYFATCPSSGSITIHESKTGKVVEQIPASSGSKVVLMGPRRESRYVYYGGADKTVHVWDRKDRISALSISGHKSPITSLSLSVDETSLVSTSSSGAILLQSLKTNTSTQLSSPFHQTINKSAFCPFKKSLVLTGGDEGTLCIHDIHHGTSPIYLLKDAHLAPIHGLAWSPCHKSLFCSAGLDRKVKVYNNDQKGKVVLEWEAAEPVTSLSVNDEFQIAAGTLGGRVMVYDIRNKRESVMQFNAGNEAVTGLLFEPPQWAQETAHREIGAVSSRST